MKRKAKDGALKRAVEVWQGTAVVIRGDLRKRGVVGPLRTLDLIASGTRCPVAAPVGLTRFAIEMREHGLSEAVAAARLTNVAQQITALVYHDPAA